MLVENFEVSGASTWARSRELFATAFATAGVRCTAEDELLCEHIDISTRLPTRPAPTRAIRRALHRRARLRRATCPYPRSQQQQLAVFVQNEQTLFIKPAPRHMVDRTMRAVRDCKTSPMLGVSAVAEGHGVRRAISRLRQLTHRRVPRPASSSACFKATASCTQVPASLQSGARTTSFLSILPLLKVRTRCSRRRAVVSCNLEGRCWWLMRHGTRGLSMNLWTQCAATVGIAFR